MKYIDINKRFTALVTDYIAKGYIINSASMGGSQGERAKVDLTNGIEIIRIQIDTFHDWNSDLNLEGYQIIIGRSTDNVQPNSSNDWSTVWSSHLEVISCERFYKIGSDRLNGEYLGTLEEAEQASEKRSQRYYLKKKQPVRFVPTPEMMAVAKKIVRSRFGVKRINDSEIKLSKYQREYTVSYRSKSYTLR